MIPIIWSYKYLSLCPTLKNVFTVIVTEVYMKYNQILV